MSDDAGAAEGSRRAEQGIHRLAIPTPFAVGRVNTYLIEDDPLTLVDSGPNSGKALDELERQLARAGHAIEDLDLLVITHQHIDHLGLVDILARRSGAEVAALDRLAPLRRATSPRTPSSTTSSPRPDAASRDPRGRGAALRSVSRAFRAWGASAQVTRRLRDGEELSLRDRRLDGAAPPRSRPSDTSSGTPTGGC